MFLAIKLRLYRGFFGSKVNRLSLSRFPVRILPGTWFLLAVESHSVHLSVPSETRFGRETKGTGPNRAPTGRSPTGRMRDEGNHERRLRRYDGNRARMTEERGSMEDLTTVTGFFRHSFRSSLTSSGVSVRVSLHSFLLPRVFARHTHSSLNRAPSALFVRSRRVWIGETE